jgi:hypothetical protein
MKKSMVLSIVLLTSTIKADAPVAPVQPVATITAATAATAADLNKTQQALQAKIDVLTGKVNQLIQAGTAGKEELSLTLKELAQLIADSQKTTPAAHPCAAFSNGSKDASYAASLIINVMVAFAGRPAEQLEEKLLFAFYPLFHQVVHTDAAQLNNGSISKWIVSNWTTLGLTGTVYILGRALNWEPAKVLRVTLAVIYGQGAAALALAQLNANEESEQLA